MRLSRGPGIVAGVTIAVAVLVAACASSGSSSGAGSSGGEPLPGALKVVTSTTVFADMVRNVGGDLVDVTSLVPKNGDVHTFEPRPADVQQVAEAKLLVMN